MELVSMAKKEMEKKEFAWDTEKKIGEFGDSKLKTEVRICTLNGNTYVSAQQSVMSAKTGDWKRTKNNTMRMDIFKGLQDIVGKWELEAAFGTDGLAEVVEAPKKSGGLKAKQQAAGARAKASEEKKEALKLKDLSADEQKELKSALKGNGMKVADVNIIKDGNRLAIEVKASKQIVVIR